MITLLQHQIKVAWYKPLRAAIVKAKITKQDLAQQTGLAKHTLDTLLRGQTGTRLSTLFALTDALGLDIWLTDKDGHSWRLKP